MRRNNALAVIVASATAALVLAVIVPTAAQSPAAALTGLVSSQDEGAMGGVLVSAKRAASTITITIVSDEDGRTAFPGAGWNRARTRFAFEQLGTN